MDQKKPIVGSFTEKLLRNGDEKLKFKSLEKNDKILKRMPNSCSRPFEKGKGYVISYAINNILYVTNFIQKSLVTITTPKEKKMITTNF